MSALFEEDAALLEDVFALIDAYDDFTSEGSNSESPKPLDAISTPRPNHKSVVTKKKKRIRRPETSSTAFQRRKKAEVVALRNEVAVLETRLKRLELKNEAMWQKYAGTPKKAAEKEKEHQLGTNDTFWCGQAVEQYRRRLESEQRNAKLKEIWESQGGVVRELRSILQRDNLLYGRDVVFGEELQQKDSKNGLAGSTSEDACM